MRTIISTSLATAAALFISSAAYASDLRYEGFPVTLKGYQGDETTSVSYSGQVARAVLHDSLKKLASQGNGSANPKLKAQMLAYFSGTDKGRDIIAPVTKGKYIIAETKVDELSSGKNIAGKTFGGTISGMPGGMTGVELVEFWIDKASSADGGVDLETGMNYPQLISKFIMGAMMYNQAVDNYLDEKLAADNKPNNKPYGDGKHYTGKEHSWDEAFGYFGAPVHAMSLKPADAYNIAKMGGTSDAETVLAIADVNGNGKVDLKTEMVYGPAYYAAGADKSGKTTYLRAITEAFINGRQVIADAKGEALSDDERAQLRQYASVIERHWQTVLAEAAFKYAGSVYKDMHSIHKLQENKSDTTKAVANYIKHWGELKGFVLALQTGKSNLGGVATGMNRLIGAGPIMLDGMQVTNIDSNGNYVRSEANWDEYMVGMVKVQNLLANSFPVEAKANDATGELSALLEKVGSGGTVEND